MPNTTLLCVGSGMAPRYRLNTLQTLAMPYGAHIQFRYSSDLIPDALRKKLESTTLKNARVLLGHVDCTKTGRRLNGYCRITACRFAKLVYSRKVGSVFVLRFELEDFAITSDVQRFEESLPSGLPHWQQNGQGEKLEGSWCQEVPPEFEGCARSNDIDSWQTIVSKLKKCEDFTRQLYYYTVEGLFEGIGKSRVHLRNGEYVLRSSKDYELRVFHWDPTADAHAGHGENQWLRLDVVEPWLQVRTNPILAIDSPYDLKSVQIRTGSAVRREHSSMFLHEGNQGLLSDRISVELYLPVTIKGTMGRSVSYGLIVGCLLTAQQLLAIFSRDHVGPWIPLTIAAAVLGLVTGFFVAFGMRKPI